MKRLSSRKGAAMLEYGILVALITAGSVALIASLGGQVTTAFQNVLNAMTGGGTP